MSWLSLITGLFRPAKELVEVFKPNAEKEAERGHVERMALSEQDMASLAQFAAEFHARTGATWWDSFVDGLNRLPRPLITLGVLAFFIIAPLQPVRFLEIAQAYQMMPDGFWALLGVIIAFYFGGRMQLKRDDMAVKGGALQVAQEILAIRRAERELDQQRQTAGQGSAPADQPDPAPSGATSPDATIADGAGPRPNRIVQEWRRLQMANGQK
jgi:hypothetical protein